MKVAVAYESMFGNTRRIATAVGEGLGEHYEVEVWCVADQKARDLGGVALLVAGGPTHAWGMSRPSTRQAAAKQAADPTHALTLDPGAVGPGLREWLAGVDLTGIAVAAFDTRIAMPVAFTGTAARSIERALRRRGGHVIARRHSFLVTKLNALVDGQLDLARAWGAQLAEDLAADPVSAR